MILKKLLNILRKVLSLFIQGEPEKKKVTASKTEEVIKQAKRKRKVVKKRTDIKDLPLSDNFEKRMQNYFQNYKAPAKESKMFRKWYENRKNGKETAEEIERAWLEHKMRKKRILKFQRDTFKKSYKKAAQLLSVDKIFKGRKR